MKTSNKLKRWIEIYYSYSSEDIKADKHNELMQLKEIIKEIKELEK